MEAKSEKKKPQGFTGKGDVNIQCTSTSSWTSANISESGLERGVKEEYFLVHESHKDFL